MIVETGPDVTITDHTQQCEWWGWGSFSENEPTSGWTWGYTNTRINDSSVTLTDNYDSRHVT